MWFIANRFDLLFLGRDCLTFLIPHKFIKIKIKIDKSDKVEENEEVNYTVVLCDCTFKMSH